MPVENLARQQEHGQICGDSAAKERDLRLPSDHKIGASICKGCVVRLERPAHVGSRMNQVLGLFVDGPM